MGLQMVQKIQRKWIRRIERPNKNKKTSDVPKETMLKIKNELADSNTGWDFRQVMDLIYKREE